ncbi:MAG: response regulator [Crocinitomicaceae bacterium]|nr:response regulator [Crocinitomicaceae bacterium]MDG1657608.1 response regulator [Crocinitomicaceae bacterium]MDG2440496.1 response regulator [Crocinitomicaceae bacterium]|tara:strand:- start:70 stop:828 length:759 start_codon:yes stop_codon:yes gene_type:complete
MSKINVLVVEDESIVSKDIQHSLKKLGYNIVGSSATAEKAIELAKSEHPDVVLMDIMLKGEMNGIEAADEIRKSCAIPVIFLTAYADESTLSKAKVTEPYGYILKPFKEIDLHTTIEMAIYKHGREQEIVKQRDLLFSLVENKDANEQGYVFVKSNSKLVKLKNEDIYYIEALKDYVVIHTLKTRYTIHSTMKDIDAKMGKEKFVRVHRSFIVQLSRIATIEYPNLTLENIDKSIPIGGSYRDDLNKRIKLV